MKKKETEIAYHNEAKANLEIDFEMLDDCSVNKTDSYMDFDGIDYKDSLKEVLNSLSSSNTKVSIGKKKVAQ